MKPWLTKFLISVFFIISLVFTAHADKEWTFLVYLDADNDLESYGIADFLEMASVGSDNNIKIVVQMDRIPGYDTSYDDWYDTRRGLVSLGDVPDSTWGTSIGEADMGDPDTLRDFIIWGAANYSAKRYAVVLWNHGDGWRDRYIELVKNLKAATTDADKEKIGDEIEKLLSDNLVSPDIEQIINKQIAPTPDQEKFGGDPVDGVYKSICWDDTDGSHLNTKDVQTALMEAKADVGAGNPVMDLIGFDACQMGMVEVAYEMRNSKTGGSYMVGSEDNEPGDGWPYNTILGDLKSTPTMSPKDLSINIVDRYTQSYTGTAVTLCSVDLNKIVDLSNAISSFALDMINYWDISSQMHTIRTSAATVKNVYDSTVIYAQASAAGAYGLTINFPNTGADSTYIGANIDFAKDCKWRSFLIEFPFMIGSWIDTARSATGFIGNYYDIYGFADNIVGPYDFTLDPTTLSINETGTGTTGTIDVNLEMNSGETLASDVTIVVSIIDNKPVSSEANAQVQGSGELLFPAGSTSNTVKTVTIQGIDDVYAGDDTCKAKFAIKAGSDPNFTHLDPKTVDVTVVSDEVAQVMVDPDTLTVAEDGGTDTYDVYLDGKPRGNVSLAVLSLDTDEATVLPSTINFTTNNYGDHQTCTVTGVPDNFVGDDVVDIQNGVKTAASDPAYLASTAAFVTVTCTDDSGWTADYNVAPGLWAKSRAYIVGNNCVSSDDEWYVCTVAGTSGTIEPNWDTAIRNTTTDNTVTWMRIATLADPTTVSLEITETGGKDYFTVVLNGRPHDPVKINMVSSDITKATVSKSSLTFTKDNWDIPQTVTVTGVDDDLVGDASITIDLSVDPTSDSHFVTENHTASLPLTVNSDDTPGFTVTPKTLKIQEDYQSKTFDVVLTKGPVQDNVVLDITPQAIGDLVGGVTVTGEVTVNQAELTFDSTNWNIPQTVTVTSVHNYTLGDKIGMVDIDTDVAKTYAQWIETPAAQYVTVNLTNVDVAGFTLSKTDLTVKEGTTGLYSIVLDAKPDNGETVTINVASSDTGEATVATNPVSNPVVVVFDDGNWNVKQNIIVSGVVDEYATDDSAIVTNTVDSSSDPNFIALKKKTVNILVTNDNAINSAELTLSVNNLTINELAPGNTGTFTVMLDAKPHSNVLVTVKSSDTGEATVSTGLLTFTPSNWNIAQTVTVTGVDNNFLGDGTSRISLKVQTSGSDPTFHTAAEKFVDTTITENDPNDYGGINFSETKLVVANHRSKKTFYVSLTARPRTNVVITLTSADADKVTVLPTTLTFTTTSWNTPKKVTVIGDPNKDPDFVINQQTVDPTASGDSAWVNSPFKTADPQLEVTVTANTDSGYDVSPTTLEIDENDAGGNPGEGEFYVVLTQAPTGNVVIDISPNPAYVDVTPVSKQLTFTTANWNDPQTVTLTNNQGDITTDYQLVVTCSVNAATADSTFKTLADQTVVVKIKNLNPVVNDDTADAITNKAGVIAANEPILIRVLDNDTDPRGSELDINAVSAASGGTTAISDDNKTIIYTPPAAAGSYSFTYTVTNNLAYNAVSPNGRVDVDVYEGQQVACGSIVDLNATDIGLVQFNSKAKLYTTYIDPWRSNDKKYSLSCLTKVFPTTDGKTEHEFKKRIKLYNASALNKAYKTGTGFADFVGQKTSLIFDAFASYEKVDTQMSWKLLVTPPKISAVKRFTTPQDDLDAPTAAWAADLHNGSIIHVFGKFFGNKKPKVWLEYEVNGAMKKARCKVLSYNNPNFLDSKDKLGYMDVQPTSATYGDSELKVMFPTRFPKTWPYGAFTLIIDNGVGLASFADLSGGVKNSSDTNDPPVGVDDAFDGANEGAKIKANSKNNLLDVLNNDEFPNCDDVKITIVGKPDNGGKARWDRKTGKIKYTPAKDFGADAEQVETFTYRITERYTDQKLSSTATVQVTVEP